MVQEVHSSGDELEAYALGTPFDVDLERVEDHLCACERCQDELATRNHLVRLGEERRLQSIHITEDGPIFGSLHCGADGKWVARHWGRQLDGGWAFGSQEEANDYLTESFQQMFPEHLCTSQCSN